MGTSRTIKEKPKGAGEMPAIGPGKTVKAGRDRSESPMADTPSAKVKGMKTQYGGE